MGIHDEFEDDNIENLQEKPKQKGKLKQKMNKLVAEITMVAFLLVGCEGKISSEIEFAKDYDTAEKLLTFKDTYEKNHTVLNLVTTEDIENCKRFSHELADSLLKIPGINKKVIIIDVPAEKGVIINDILKGRGFDSTFNVFINWSGNVQDEGNEKVKTDAVDYSKLFSTLKYYVPQNSKGSHHIQEAGEIDKQKIINTLPWAVVIDHSRIPAKIEEDETNNFNNAYVLEEKYLPQFAWFKGKDKIREGIVFVSGMDVNPDIKEWLDSAHEKGIPIDVVPVNDRSYEILKYDGVSGGFVGKDTPITNTGGATGSFDTASTNQPHYNNSLLNSYIQRTMMKNILSGPDDDKRVHTGSGYVYHTYYNGGYSRGYYKPNIKSTYIKTGSGSYSPVKTASSIRGATGKSFSIGKGMGAKGGGVSIGGGRGGGGGG